MGVSAPVLTRERLRCWACEFAGFGVVGGLGYVTDLVVFNTVLYAGGLAVLSGHPLAAKMTSSLAALVVTYLGNRHWTWRGRSCARRHREVALFAAFNVVGIAIALACLGTSHYLLGFTTPLADNIAANIVGVALGGLFRFWTYRTYVFRPVAA